MYRRSEIRHACFRAKKNAATEENKKVLAIVEPLLDVHQRWENFGTVWDVLLDSNSNIIIIKPETDYDFIHTTCIEASLYKKNGIKFDSFSDRQKNIIVTVETLMLDNLMSWESYGKAWGVEVDQSTKTIKTRLYNVRSSQIEVTDEMIKSSMKDADGSAFTEKEENVLEAKPMNAEQQKAFEEFLAKKYAQKG